MSERKPIYDVPVGEYSVRGFYRSDSDIHADVEVWKGDELVKKAEVLAYRIWNYAAHAEDVVESIQEAAK